MELDISRAGDNKETKAAFSHYLKRAAKHLDDEAPLKRQRLMKHIQNQELEHQERQLKIALIKNQLSGMKHNKPLLSVESTAGGADQVDDCFESNSPDQSPEELFDEDPKETDIDNVPSEPEVRIPAKTVPLQVSQQVAKTVPLLQVSQHAVAKIAPLQVPQQVVVQSVPRQVTRVVASSTITALKSTRIAAASTFLIRQPNAVPYVIKKVPVISEASNPPAKTAMANFFSQK